MLSLFHKYLREEYRKKGMEEIAIHASSFVSLNGRPSQRFLDRELDLTRVTSINDIYRHTLPLEDQTYNCCTPGSGHQSRNYADVQQ